MTILGLLFHRLMLRTLFRLGTPPARNVNCFLQIVVPSPRVLACNLPHDEVSFLGSLPFLEHTVTFVGWPEERASDRALRPRHWRDRGLRALGLQKNALVVVDIWL